MRMTLAELATHKVFAQFATGDTVNITVYDRTNLTTPSLSSAACTEIGSTGLFEWSFGNLSSQPTGLTQYVWIMSNGSTQSQPGTVTAGGYPDTIDELIASPSGVVAVETPWVVGNLPAGGTVAIRVFDSTGVEEVLTTNVCTEFISGYYRWSTSNMSVYPSSVGSYMWIMTDSVSGRTTWGITPIGTPEDLGEVAADGVWDALTADHNDADTFGRFVQGIPTAAEIRQEMDSNSIQLSSIRTAVDTTIPGTLTTIDDKVDDILEDTGTTLPASFDIIEDKVDFLQDTATDILEDTGTTLPATLAGIEGKVDVVDGVADAILVDTNRLDGLVEDDGGGNDRFTAKALEEAPVVASGDIQSACEDALDAKGLDHLVSASVAGADVADNSVIAKMFSKSATADFDTFDNTTDSLEAIADSSATPPTAQEIRIEMDNNSTKLIGIKGDTEDIKDAIDNLPTDPEEWTP